MKFSPKCRTKKLGMLNTHLGSFCISFNWEGADIRPQIRPRKISGDSVLLYTCIIYSHHMYILQEIKHDQNVAKLI